MIELLTLCLGVAGVILIPAVVGYGRWLAKNFEAIRKTLDDQNVELAKLKQHVTPNHGSSLRDVVDRIEDSTTEMKGAFKQHLDQSKYDTERFDRAIAALNSAH